MPVDGDEGWRSTLEAARVADLQIPEFRRYARPFAPESAGPQPGLVFEFSTNVTRAELLLGTWVPTTAPNPSRFATRIRSAVPVRQLRRLPLADDPNVYLIPVGQTLRSPDPLDFTVRQWQVVEQKIPVPFPIGAAELGRYDWVPTESLDGARTDLIRYPMMRAFHYSEPFDDNQVSSDSRLIGRSVWNRRWLLIIPGSTFLADPNDGLDTFIHGAKVPGGNGVRDTRRGRHPHLLQDLFYSGTDHEPPDPSPSCSSRHRTDVLALPARASIDAPNHICHGAPRCTACRPRPTRWWKHARRAAARCSHAMSSAAAATWATATASTS